MDEFTVIPITLTSEEPLIEQQHFIDLVKFLSPNQFLEFSVKSLSGGFANDIVCLSFPDGQKFVLRIFREAVASIVNRDQEIVVHSLLADNSLAALIVCKFENGICYSLICENMARLHDIRLTKYGNISKESSFVWSKMHEFVGFVDNNFPNIFSQESIKGGYTSSSAMRNRIEELRTNICKFENHPACSLSLCHNDLLFTNIILNDDSGVMLFIDFEYADVNYCSFDIGNFFDEFAGVDPVESIDYSRYPEKNYQIKWLKHYLKHRRQWNKATGEELNHLAEEFYVVVQKMALVSHVFWSLMVLIQSQIIPNSSYDYIAYGSLRLAEYERRKNSVFALLY